MKKSYWLTKIIFDKQENSYDVLGADIIYLKGEVGSVIDIASCENPNRVSEPAIAYIYTQPELFPELINAGLKRLPDRAEEFLASKELKTTKLKRVASSSKIIYG